MACQVSYTLRLTARPLEKEKVQIRMIGDYPGEYSVSPEELEFTLETWHQPQTVVVHVPEDASASSTVS